MRWRPKPAGWPSYMVSKKQSRGGVAFYWQPPTWARQCGLPLRPEALGTDFAQAKARCVTTSLILNSWHGAQTTALVSRIRPWALSTGWWTSIGPRQNGLKLAAGTRADYERVLTLVTQHKLKDGRKFGDLSLNSITPGAADKIHEQILATESGESTSHSQARNGCLSKSMGCCLPFSSWQSSCTKFQLTRSARLKLSGIFGESSKSRNSRARKKNIAEKWIRNWQSIRS